MIKAEKKNNKMINIFDPSHILSQNTRLAIMITLITKRKIIFTELHRIVGVTPGNLDSHLKKLENQEYVEIRKSIVQNSPRTIIILTTEGYRSTILYVSKLKKAFDKYIKKD